MHPFSCVCTYSHIYASSYGYIRACTRIHGHLCIYARIEASRRVLLPGLLTPLCSNAPTNAYLQAYTRIYQQQSIYECFNVVVCVIVLIFGFIPVHLLVFVLVVVLVSALDFVLGSFLVSVLVYVFVPVLVFVPVSVLVPVLFSVLVSVLFSALFCVLVSVLVSARAPILFSVLVFVLIQHFSQYRRSFFHATSATNFSALRHRVSFRLREGGFPTVRRTNFLTHTPNPAN